MPKAPENSLDADYLMNEAAASAGLDDFGDLSFVEPLRQCLAAAGRYVSFSETGLATYTAGIVNDLVNRLRLTRDLKRHPEILDEDVSDPIVIFGLPRTGTTKLQRMMSADPANQSLLFWKILNFAPFPEAVSGEADPRIAVGKAACEYTETAHPEVLKVHATYYDQADEDSYLVGASYEHFVNTVTLSEPDYSSYIQARPAENPYRYLRTVLKYLQWQQGGKRGPWILKAPTHLGYINTVFSMFPNATLVQTHRDVVTAFASLCHLIELASLMHGDRADPLRIGRDQLRIWTIEWGRHRADRGTLTAADRLIDVDYEKIRNDPFSVIEDVYALAGRNLSEAGRAAMASWQTENRKDRHGRHEYRLEDYGVTRTQVEEAFVRFHPPSTGSAAAPGI
ncbi:MAG: sulfotransferase [Gammaproteobacteria bacterium]|nr:sulfotransferase [Gammaproteobacteria bacterium]